jgi:hypothetical protein
MLAAVTYRAIEPGFAVFAYLPVGNNVGVAVFMAIHARGSRNPGILAYTYHGNRQDQHEE